MVWNSTVVPKFWLKAYVKYEQFGTIRKVFRTCLIGTLFKKLSSILISENSVPIVNYEFQYYESFEYF